MAARRLCLLLLAVPALVRAADGPPARSLDYVADPRQLRDIWSRLERSYTGRTRRAERVA